MTDDPQSTSPADAADATEAWQLDAQIPALRAQDHRDLAAALGERLLEIRDATQGPAHPDTLAVIDGLSEDYFRISRFERAAALLERLLAAYEAAEPRDPVEIGRALGQLAKVRRRMADLPAAEALYRRALTTYQEVEDKARAVEGVATATHGLAVLLLDRDDLEEAEVACRMALTLREKLYQPGDFQIAETLNVLAIIHRHKGDLDGAEQLYLRALGGREAAHDAEQSISTLANLAFLYEQRGQHDKAGPLLQRAAALVEARGGPPDEVSATVIEALGHQRDAEGDHEGAIDHLRRALAIREELLGPTHPVVATAMTNLAALLSGADETRAEAEDLMRRALAAVAETPAVAGFAKAMLNLAAMRVLAEDLDEAEALADKALALARERHGAEHPEVADALFLLSRIDEEREDYEGALRRMSTVLHIRNKKPDLDQAIADLTRIGELFLADEDPDQAAKFLKDALGYAAAARGKQHPSVGHLTYLAAKVAMAQEQPKLALHCLDTAVPILEKAHGKHHVQLVGPLHVLSEAHIALGKLGAAEKAITRIAEIYARNEPPESEMHALPEAFLGDVAMKRKAHAKALTHYERALGIAERAFGRESIQLHVLLEKAGDAAVQAGSLDRAEDLANRLLVMLEAEIGPDHPNLLPPVRQLAEVYMAKKDPRAAEWLGRVTTLLEAGTKALNEDTAQIKAKLARERGQS
jgi:tetratricopeptide (TPR) repeat protein